MRRITKVCIGVFASGFVAQSLLIASIWPVFEGLRKNTQVRRQNIEPLFDLQPVLYDTGFGRFLLEFHTDSKLTDTNCDRLLILNQVPSEYFLSLEITTPEVTDASLPVLAQLESLDLLIVDEAGLSEAGLLKLDQLLPGVLTKSE